MQSGSFAFVNLTLFISNLYRGVFDDEALYFIVRSVLKTTIPYDNFFCNLIERLDVNREVALYLLQLFAKLQTLSFPQGFLFQPPTIRRKFRISKQPKWLHKPVFIVKESLHLHVNSLIGYQLFLSNCSINSGTP
jgi:hypothetical protein